MNEKKISDVVYPWDRLMYSFPLEDLELEIILDRFSATNVTTCLKVFKKKIIAHIERKKNWWVYNDCWKHADLLLHGHIVLQSGISERSMLEWPHNWAVKVTHEPAVPFERSLHALVVDELSIAYEYSRRVVLNGFLKINFEFSHVNVGRYLRENFGCSIINWLVLVINLYFVVTSPECSLLCGQVFSVF